MSPIFLVQDKFCILKLLIRNPVPDTKNISGYHYWFSIYFQNWAYEPYLNKRLTSHHIGQILSLLVWLGFCLFASTVTIPSQILQVFTIGFLFISETSLTNHIQRGDNLKGKYILYRRSDIYE